MDVKPVQQLLHERLKDLNAAHYAGLVILVIVVSVAAEHWDRGVVPLLKFIYACFLQPLGMVSGQKERLDRFYAAQADGTSTHAHILL